MMEQRNRFRISRTSIVAASLSLCLHLSWGSTAGKNEAQRPSDPVYKELRQLEIGETRIATLDNFTLRKDVATFTFRNGQLVLFPPVMGRVTGAVFIGDGDFLLEPAISIEQSFLKVVQGSGVLREPFKEAVFHFTDQTMIELKKKLTFKAGANREAASILEKHKRYMRKKLKYNTEAGILTQIYDASSPGNFLAFIKGEKHDKLLFSVDPRGFDTELGPEEVALMNYDPNHFGIWYLSHLKSEWEQGTASSNESKFLVDVLHFAVETTIEKGKKLTATAEITLKPLVAGPQVLYLGLVPALRVSRITDEDGTDLLFIQEDKKEDGSLHVIFPEPLEKDHTRRITVQYSGKGVIRDAGGGSFYVGERTGWYPSLNSFKDYATYDLTFHVHKDYQLVATGQPVGERAEKKWRVTQWKSNFPLAVAGFNYGKYKKKSVKDSATQYDIEVYATRGKPDWLRQPLAFQPDLGSPRTTGFDGARAMASQSVSPQRLSESIMEEGHNSIRVFSHYFGELPYGRVAISQQPEPFFGQSWPMLVYLPLTAFMDSTQLNFLFGSQSLRKFTKEVGSHEIAHQWWGHLVGWKSYHDQWLSEGFASFAAGLYLQHTKDRKRFVKYWRDQREEVLEKNRYGFAPNDAGPIWLGRRLGMAEKLEGSYQPMVYSKGAFVLRMLRMLMFDPEKQDQRFIEMMKNFTRSYAHRAASTEDFKRIAEKHITPVADLRRDGKLDWFFNQWVYGTKIPTYKFTSEIKSEGGEKYTVSGSLTQSNVTSDFVMPVPIYLDFGKDQYVRLGGMVIQGNTTVPLRSSITIKGKPKRLIINANEDILCHLDTR